MEPFSIAMEDSELDVVPIHVLGVIDIDMMQMPSSDLTAFVCQSKQSHEGRYAVRHGIALLNEFGETVEG